MTTTCVTRAFGSAERAGFEPAVGFNPYAALAKRCFRPLSHLSGVPRVRVLILARPVPSDNGPAAFERRPAVRPGRCRPSKPSNLHNSAVSEPITAATVPVPQWAFRGRVAGRL